MAARRERDDSHPQMAGCSTWEVTVVEEEADNISLLVPGA